MKKSPIQTIYLTSVIVPFAISAIRVLNLYRQEHSKVHDEKQKGLDRNPARQLILL
jgi:hypothetical protein